MKRGICKRGHVITDATAYRWGNKRQCGICKRATRRLKTHCKRGHIMTPANTRITAGGWRQCLDCLAFTIAERIASKGHVHHKLDMPDKPVVERVAYRVVIDPWAVAIFGRRRCTTATSASVAGGNAACLNK